MFLSIIIPVYNAETFIEDCLNSCINQNFMESEYELICINDGSSDNSLSILQKYADTVKNITIINQENSGVSSARNSGIKIAKGDYIWFVDADDMIFPNCIIELFKTVQKKDYDIISFSGFSFFNADFDSVKKQISTEEINGNFDYYGYIFLHIIKRSILIESGILFDKSIKFGEDELFYVLLNENINASVSLEKVFYLYRRHEQSVMSQWETHKDIRMNSVIRSMQIIKEKIENGDCKKDLSLSFLKGRYNMFYYLIEFFNAKEAFCYIKQMRTYHLLPVDKSFSDIPTSKFRFILHYCYHRSVTKLANITNKIFCK